MMIEVSNWEIVDKYTILCIKGKKIQDDEKLKNINNEKNSLQKIVHDIIDTSSELFSAIMEINEKLWNIEDSIREKEKVKEFDGEFIKLARSVYYTNDLRAELKKKININSNSNFVEEKSYEQY